MILYIKLNPIQEASILNLAKQKQQTPEELAETAIDYMLSSEQIHNRHSTIPITSFRGAGKHAPIGMDAQQYINELRSEWDHRP